MSSKHGARRPLTPTLDSSQWRRSTSNLNEIMLQWIARSHKISQEFAVCRARSRSETDQPVSHRLDNTCHGCVTESVGPGRMVHADSSQFARGLSKKEVYSQILEQASALFDGQRNWVCNLANTASLLWHGYHSLPPPSSNVNWSGFYVIDPRKPSQLILGPFHGQVACQTIRIGRGVCGAAAETKITQLVDDVETFPGHIACDGASKSEIVVPILQNGEVVAIIDIDCAVLNGFDSEDQAGLEELAALIAASSDF